MNKAVKCIMPLGKTTVHLMVFHCVIKDICGKCALSIKAAQLILQTCLLVVTWRKYQSFTQSFFQKHLSRKTEDRVLRTWFKIPVIFLLTWHRGFGSSDASRLPKIIQVADWKLCLPIGSSTFLMPPEEISSPGFVESEGNCSSGDSCAEGWSST